MGEAGFFLDPLYSLGSDFIAIGNTITVEMVRRERAGELTEAAVESYNQLVLDVLFPTCLGFYQGTYRTFGHAQIFTPKLAWDTAILWAFVHAAYSQGFITQPTDEFFAIGQRYLALNNCVQQLFSDWSENAPSQNIYVRGDMTRMRFLQLLHLEWSTRRSPEQALEAVRKNLDRFEKLAQALFWQAVMECYPDNSALKQRLWLDAWKMVLDPEKCAEQGLFKAETTPRPISPMCVNLSGILSRKACAIA